MLAVYLLSSFSPVYLLFVLGPLPFINLDSGSIQSFITYILYKKATRQNNIKLQMNMRLWCVTFHCILYRKRHALSANYFSFSFVNVICCRIIKARNEIWETYKTYFFKSQVKIKKAKNNWTKKTALIYWILGDNKNQLWSIIYGNKKFGLNSFVSALRRYWTLQLTNGHKWLLNLYPRTIIHMWAQY